MYVGLDTVVPQRWDLGREQEAGLCDFESVEEMLQEQIDFFSGSLLSPVFNKIAL